MTFTASRGPKRVPEASSIPFLSLHLGLQPEPSDLYLQAQLPADL